MRKIFYTFTSIILFVFLINGQKFEIYSIPYYLAIPLSQIFTLNSLIYTLTLIFSLTASVLSIFIDSYYIRFFVFIGINIFFSLINSSGKIDHDLFLICLESFIFIFIKNQKTKNETSNELILMRIIQVSHLAIYFNAGLWKLRGLLSQNNFTQAFLAHGKESLAYVTGEGSIHIENIPRFLFLNDFIILKLGFFFVFVFQLTSFIPVFFKKMNLSWGFLIIFFHLTNYFILGVGFYVTTVLALVNFVIFELYLSKQATRLASHD